MDNIIVEKVWNDGNLIELRIVANSQFITAYQSCYVSEEQLDELLNQICSYVQKGNSVCYWETGPKTGRFPAAFSVRILPVEVTGHVLMELDMEIEDNTVRAHRCTFYVKTELGLLERFGKSLRYLKKGEIGSIVSLHER